MKREKVRKRWREGEGLGEREVKGERWRESREREGEREVKGERWREGERERAERERDREREREREGERERSIQMGVCGMLLQLKAS